MVLYGMNVVVTDSCVEEKRQVIHRSWHDRMFSRPWKPWEDTFVVLERVALVLLSFLRIRR